MVFIQWIQQSTPLARNLVRKILRANHFEQLERAKASGTLSNVLPHPAACPTPFSSAKANANANSNSSDGESTAAESTPPEEPSFIMRTKEILERGLQMEEGIVPGPPTALVLSPEEERMRLLKKMGKKSKRGVDPDFVSCPPPNMGHVFRSQKYLKDVLKSLIPNEITKASFHVPLTHPMFTSQSLSSKLTDGLRGRVFNGLIPVPSKVVQGRLMEMMREKHGGEELNKKKKVKMTKDKIDGKWRYSKVPEKMFTLNPMEVSTSAAAVPAAPTDGEGDTGSSNADIDSSEPTSSTSTSTSTSSSSSSEPKPALTVVLNGWKLVNPNSTFFDPVPSSPPDPTQTGEHSSSPADEVSSRTEDVGEERNPYWKVLRRDSDKEVIPYKQRKKMREAERTRGSGRGRRTVKEVGYDYGSGGSDSGGWDLGGGGDGDGDGNGKRMPRRERRMMDRERGRFEKRDERSGRDLKEDEDDDKLRDMERRLSQMSGRPSSSGFSRSSRSSPHSHSHSSRDRTSPSSRSSTQSYSPRTPSSRSGDRFDEGGGERVWKDERGVDEGQEKLILERKRQISDSQSSFDSRSSPRTPSSSRSSTYSSSSDSESPRTSSVRSSFSRGPDSGSSFRPRAFPPRKADRWQGRGSAKSKESRWLKSSERDGGWELGMGSSFSGSEGGSGRKERERGSSDRYPSRNRREDSYASSRTRREDSNSEGRERGRGSGSGSGFGASRGRGGGGGRGGFGSGFGSGQRFGIRRKESGDEVDNPYKRPEGVK